jgi:cellobiose epimerase
MPFDPTALRCAIEEDLTQNLLPFWVQHTPDPENGGFYGALTNDLQVRNDVPRSAVLYARILWTFSSAYRLYGVPAYLELAHWAYAYIQKHFIDAQYGGVFWAVDLHGQPVDRRKHSYAQAFTIYGLSEYFRATRTLKSLACAQELFRHLEEHAYDPLHGGYVEGCAQDWGALEDMRLSDKEPNCRKSMNTLLHIMEAYTNLLRAWDDAGLRQRQQELIQGFLLHVINPQTKHFDLFFDDEWNVLPERNHVSFGHDIEGSWLLVEAAEELGDPLLLEKCKQTAVEMAQVVLVEGRAADGSLWNARGSLHGDEDHVWWGQAEGVVGFYNAYQLTGHAPFAEAAQRLWTYIDTHFVDRQNGEWFKVVRKDGTPDREIVKTGPWECPYHSCRMGFEMLGRL